MELTVKGCAKELATFLAEVETQFNKAPDPEIINENESGQTLSIDGKSQAIKIRSCTEERMKRVEELRRLSQPMMDYLFQNYGPYCTVMITGQSVRMVGDEI